MRKDANDIFYRHSSNWSTARDINAIVNSLCLDALVIVFCAVEVPLGLVFSTRSPTSSDFHSTIPTERGLREVRLRLEK